MSQPTPYNRIASLSNIQAQAPTDPLPGNTLDAEFNAVKATLDAILTNLAEIQRDDGALANESVGSDQLAEELSAGINAWTVWITATTYAVSATVFHTSGVYRCTTAHTSGTFATDLSAGKWELIIDLADLTLAAAANIANTPTGSISATTVQAAIDELASEKAANSHTHASSAISDSTAAGRSMLSAANAAAQRALLGLGALALEDDIPVTDISAQLALTGIIEVAALPSSVNDWAPTGVATASTIRASATNNSLEITGLLAPTADGTIVVIENVGTTYPLTITPSSASSAAANRFLIPKPVVIGANSSRAFKYDKDGTTPRWRLLDSASNLPRGHIDGLTISNSSGDATNDIDIAAGECRGSRGILDLVLTTAITGKQLDADWAAGSSAGMRYTTAIANTTYHVFLIGKADGTTDIFAYAASADPTAVLPSGYIDYRRIGSILRESAAIVPFTQTGERFTRTTLLADVTTNNPGTSAVTADLLVPIGVTVQARIYGLISNANINATVYGLFSALTSADDTPSTIKYNACATNLTLGEGLCVENILTNTSGQIRYRVSISSSAITAKIVTRGWIDSRGKDA